MSFHDEQDGCRRQARKRLKVVLLTLAVAAIACGGTASRYMVSNAIERGEVKLSSYKYAVVHHAEGASFIELELERLLESKGLEIVGSQAVTHPSQTLRATWSEIHRVTRNGYGMGWDLTITFVDIVTDKTMLTVTAGGEGDRMSVWQQVAKQLNAALARFS